MREIGTFASGELAERFVSYLQTQSIPASLDLEGDEWVIWVQNDDDRERSRQFFAEFLAEPDAARFTEAPALAQSLQRAADKGEAEIRVRSVNMTRRWSGDWRYTHPATQIIIGLCVAVVVFCTQWSPIESGMLGLPATCNKENSGLRNALFIQAPFALEFAGHAIARFIPVDWKQGTIATLKSGEVWRLLTPAFLHFGVVHILFNMMWFKQLGQEIEFARGTRRFLVLFLVLGISSNMIQYAWSGPAFGGMSGVVFGLIGYMWMKGRTQPQLGLGLTQSQIVYSILWLLLCMGGAMGPIANGAHVGGFVVGILIGARQAIYRQLRGSTGR